MKKADLKLPTNIKVSLSIKQLALILFIILIIFGVIFLTVTGRWNLAQRLILKMKVKQHELELAKLTFLTEHNTNLLNKNSKLHNELEQKKRDIIKERLKMQLESEGASHEKIITELRNLGF